MAVVARNHEVERQMKSGKEWPETDGACTKVEKLVKGKEQKLVKEKVGAIAEVMITTTMIMVIAGMTMSEGRQEWRVEEGVNTAEEGMSGEKQRTSEGQQHASSLGVVWLKDAENEMRAVKEDWRLWIKTPTPSVSEEREILETKAVLDPRQKHIQHQQLCETNIASQSCSQIIGLPQKQPFTIDSIGNYNQQSTQELVDKNQTFKNSCNVSGSKDKSEVRSSIIIKDEYPGSLEDESQPQRRTETKLNKTQVLKCQDLVNQDHETEQATDSSEFGTETEDCRSACSNS
ncbi:PREDICTED: uncharacterized protein LOC109299696 [Gavialis gangeticus]|uniref:uncharacterized protein LOC109299696 n=1 Tax=Gavialis gangeticus TaxID=94835 RepID=UPI00092E3F4E|nr:PREDICTED: uncharacterized protein LOC109299696 [Gavialis gangeticus]